MKIKYVVICGIEKGVFNNYEAACKWFSAQWAPGLVWEFHKYDRGSLVY